MCFLRRLDSLAWVFEASVGLPSHGVSAIIEVSGCHACFPVESFLVLFEGLGVLRVMICRHKMALLQVSTDVVALVEILLLLIGNWWRRYDLVECSCNSNTVRLSVRVVHRVAVYFRAGFLLDEGGGVLGLLEGDRIVCRAPEVDACHVLRVEVLRVGPDHGIQIRIHWLLSCACPLHRCFARLLAYHPVDIFAATCNSCSWIAKIEELSLLVKITAFLFSDAIEVTFSSQILILLSSSCTWINSELIVSIASTEVFRIIWDKSCIDEVCRSFCLGILVDINQAKRRGSIVYFHEFDNSFCSICEALLTLHNAFQFLLLLFDRLCHVIILLIILLLLYIACTRLMLRFDQLVRVASGGWNHARFCVQVTSAMLTQHLLGCLDLRVRHPSLSSIFWQLVPQSHLARAPFLRAVLILHWSQRSVTCESRALYSLPLEHFLEVLNLCLAAIQRVSAWK